MVDSPEYDCQFVLVTKLTAVFHAPVRHRPGRSPSDSHRWFCTRWNSVQEQDRDRGERQHAAGVDAPGLLGVRVDPDQPVDAPLDPRRASVPATTRYM